MGNEKNKKDIIKIIVLTIIFTIIIFLINYNFFWMWEKNIEQFIAEERYIDKSIIELDDINLDIKNYKKKDKTKEVKYNFIYSPKNYKNELELLKEKIKNILVKKIFNEKLSFLKIHLIKEKVDRRWKMKDKNIILFAAHEYNNDEALAVFIHEFWHYIDLYFLEKKIFLDVSDKFYEISWESTKIKKQDQMVNDFVSWYAMTNKYEDFAESFTYYIIHNRDFLEKSKKSNIIKTKYDFFSNYIFKNKEFFNTKFNKEKLKQYYRDITKINFNESELLDYLNNF